MNEETQMTAEMTGASSTKQQWSQLPWEKIKAHVFRLQTRIAKAEREGRKSKAKSLQRLLTTSYYGKCLAVKRVTTNSGGKTPGVDGVLWQTECQKMKAVNQLKRRGYKPSRLKRIYIPKRSGNKMRPLSIPTLKDRAMGALWNMALIPIAEERADPNSYGFRPKRSTHDAIEQCFIALSKRRSATWVLEGDIKSCFDKISHEWLLENIPMDKVILKKFLKAGFMEKGKAYPTPIGSPQGGAASTTLALMALSGLERKLISKSERTRNKEKINYVSYADDFIITASSEELLREKVLPIVREHLKAVGLELSEEKTKITSIYKGFDFLGFNIRKYPNQKLLIKPSKEGIKRFLKEIKRLIRVGIALPTETLIYLLNPKISGWVNYYRSAVASKTFSLVDDAIFQALTRWGYKRHPMKGKWWIVNKYYKTPEWRFFANVKDKDGNTHPIFLKKATNTPIRRHRKILALANPFNPLFKQYFNQREKAANSKFFYTAESAGLKHVQSYEGSSGVLGN